MSKHKSIKTLLNSFFASCFLILMSVSVLAEDTEIYKNLAPPANSNIMFILDLSNSMRWDLSSDTPPANVSTERLTVMKLALDKVLSDPEMKNINIGLMGFSGINGAAEGVAHGPTFPVADAEFRSDATLARNPLFDPADKDSAMSMMINNKWTDLTGKYPWLNAKKDSWLAKLPVKALTKKAKKTVEQKAVVDEINTKEYVRLASSAWEAKGGTPIVDALYEAALYFKGEKVDYGKYLPTDHRAAHPSSYSGIIKKEALPMTLSCKDKECGGSSGLACNGTEVCTNYSAGTDKVDCWDGSKSLCESNHSTWSNCTLIPNTSCSDTCPSGAYDELGKCKSPVNICVNDDYYECDEAYSAYQECTQNVCEQVTKEVVTGDPTYISPIKNECQSSTLILMSDGRPTLNSSADKVTGLIPTSYSNNCKNNGDAVSVDVDYAGRCGIELVSYLHKEDQSTLTGDQTIETSTIGFALNGNVDAANYLKALAKKGGGEFYDAKDGDSLAASFKEAITGAGKRARSFTTPSYVVDSANLLENANDVFIPVFGTKRKPLWSGNLKKFTLKDGVIVDKAKVAATDATGILRENAQDEWAINVPAHAIEEGGAASLLDPTKRHLLTDASVTIVAGSNNVLNDITKANVTKTMLGNSLMDDTTQENLLSFIRGYEADGTTARHHMGDIVHSKPVVVSYAGGDRRVFVGTNEGYLHSFDTKTGEEKFAFMPEALLKNIDVQYRNNPQDKHVWGVDGEITVWVQDVNHNAQIDTGEKVYLFFGLRRGGKAYYALDVSDPNKDPTLLWKIDASQSDFSELGQTWSKPVLTKLRYGKNNTLRPVLIFGGGYNTRIDEQDTSVRAAASTANAGTSVYIVNAEKGTLVWKADNINITEAMEYSVPSTIRALDMDRNGSVDRLYYGDMGGNVWRVDLNAGDFIPNGDLHDLSQATLHKLAELGSNTGSDLRKFFYEPDVAFFRYHGTFYLTLAIGSGYRSHPLNENTVDRFYVLRDKYVLNTPDSNFKTIEKDSGINLDKAPVGTTRNLLATDYYGWYIDLKATQHEKVLSQAKTFMSRVAFSSFGKTAAGSQVLGSCEAVTNFQSRAYVLDLLRGDAVIDFDTATTGNEASVKISNEEIVATPQIFFNKMQSSKNKACTKDDCEQTFSIRAGKNKSPFIDATTKGGKVNISKELPKVFWRDQGS
ncbi:MAG: hypothetical protein DSZ29_03405 [Aquificaceae bacterium]|nr:MAG: hypothetical protein DSZ29_03405 [Aquificaceae bacterium]